MATDTHTPFLHTSVLLDEVVEIFEETSLKIFVDGTLGAGGHSHKILETHPEIDLFIGFDQDTSALELAKKRLDPWKDKCLFVHSNFEKIKEVLAKHKISKIDGLLLDLGVSSMQFDQSERGFSFRFDAPLDMRMDQTSSLTAREIVNEWSQRDLERVFRDYGEEPSWRRAAFALVKARELNPIETTFQLTAILEPVLRKKKHTYINPCTLVFQALRIAVNRELDVLNSILSTGIELLSPMGRFAVISFHSLEDRMVKHLFREEASDKVFTSGIGGLFLDKEPKISLLTKKPLIPSDEEVKINPRSRSAKLRAIEKCVRNPY